MRQYVYVLIAMLVAPRIVAAQSLNARRDHGLARENSAVAYFHLPRFENEAHMTRALQQGLLVPVTPTAYLDVDQSMGPGAGVRPLYLTARSFTKAYIERLARRFYRHFRSRLLVTSLARNVEYQRYLTLVNDSATDPRRGSHTTGAAFDIAWSIMNREQIHWMNERLLADEGLGLIQATREYHQRVYHIMVYPRRYVPPLSSCEHVRRQHVSPRRR